MLTVRKIQAQSATAAAKTDQYISEKKIIVPDKRSVDFKESGDAVEVQPILLENRGGELKQIVCADFMETFSTWRIFTAIKTPATNDFGADVVVNSSTSNTGLLIQCKHTENFNDLIGKNGVQLITRRELEKMFSDYKVPRC